MEMFDFLNLVSCNDNVYYYKIYVLRALLLSDIVMPELSCDFYQGTILSPTVKQLTKECSYFEC